MARRSFLVLLASMLITSTESANILMMPIFHHSHVNLFSVMGATLQKAGHNVKVLTTSDHTKAVARHGLDALVPDIPKASLLSSDEAQTQFFNSSQNPFNVIYEVTKKTRQYCIDFMESKTAIPMLERENFDLVLIDSIDPIRCHYMFPYKIGVPYITVTVLLDPWNARVPALPSMEPHIGLVTFDKEPSFFERLINFAAYCAFHILFPPSSVADNSFLQKYIPEKPETTFKELFIKSEMWFVNMESVCLDYQRIQGLHYQFLGGLGTEPARELPQDWQAFVKGAEHGLIVVTFGSALKNIPLDVLEKMLDAFERAPQRVAMRYDGPEPARKPDNVRLAKWLPQNDLLGQNETKLFITHAGNNGQLEALYHAVPMLGMPVFGDQSYNAKRAVAHGYGLYLDIFSFTSDELYQKISEIIGNPVYKENIAKCSSIFHGLPDPQESLAFWVDHVLKFGGSHLKPKFMEMSFWKFWMLDVLLFIVVLTICILYVITLCCKKVVKRCCRTNSKALKRD